MLGLPTVADRIALTPQTQLIDVTPDRVSAVPNAVRTIRTDQYAGRPISLNECYAIAAQQGRLGDGSISVFAVDPALAHTEIAEAIARFDTRFQASNEFARRETPTDASVIGGPDDLRELAQHTATVNAGFSRPLSTGGLVGITTRLDYLQTTPAAPVNPAYQPGVNFTFEQPLLRGAGIRNNLLRPVHPSGAVAGPALLFAMNGFAQSRAEFQRRLQDVLFNVSRAYWNLYSAYVTLYSREVALHQLAAQLNSAKELAEVNRVTIQDLAQIEGDYWSFRAERIRAIGNGGGLGVLEAERQLRLAIGLPPEDGTRLIPTDVPVATPFQPDWNCAVTEALTARPELVQARVIEATSRLAVERDANDLLPDLRVFGGYDVGSLGRRLGSGGDPDAVRNLFNQPAHSWQLGARIDLPVNFRSANARYRRALLSSQQQRAAVRFQEDQMLFELQRSYRQLAESSDIFTAQRKRRQAAGREVNARLEQYQAGQGLLLNLLVARRNWSDALRDEFIALAEYNVAVADFERQKGGLSRYSGVAVLESQDAWLAAMTDLPKRTAGNAARSAPPVADPYGKVPEVDDPIPVDLLFPNGLIPEPSITEQTPKAKPARRPKSDAEPMPPAKMPRSFPQPD